jgi:peptidoglycan hydrolase CwlO-like protein
MKKTIIYLLSIFIMSAAIHKPVYAEPTTEQVQAQRQQLQEEKNELKKAQEKRFDIEQKIEELDTQIEEVMDNIAENKRQIKKIQEQIRTAEADLKKAEEDIKTEQELFGKRMRAFYINGVDSYLEILLNSDGFNDFLSRVEVLKNIIEQDKKITENIKLKQEALRSQKEKLNKQNKSILAINEDNNKKMDKLKTNRDEQNGLIDEAEKLERLYAGAVNEAQSRLNETLRQIAAIRESAPKYTPSRGAAPASSNAVVAYASNFLGTPYRWGGTTPAGFDCSGFTQYVYRHFGISLGRSSRNQIYDGFGISRDELQPGDLVFYGRNGIPNHMGIYVGNGMYIHSPRTGDVIKISPYDRRDYITARRVMK